MPDSARIPTALTIAGVDPSGGAGVLADVKAMSALGAYACAVIAALTAQNTQGVTGVFGVPAAFVRQQIDTLFADVRIDAVKIGMVGQAPVIGAVADGLAHWKPGLRRRFPKCAAQPRNCASGSRMRASAGSISCLLYTSPSPRDS